MTERPPQRGEIWFVHFPTDPPEKLSRPVVIVSADVRNNHPRANTVLVVPLSTSVHKSDVPTHLALAPGETGLNERVIARAEDIAVVRKTSLVSPRQRLRSLSSSQICSLADMVCLAMDCH
jgi:mRNA-degrading endonuclease toxin of MazEF toxin-antitoxin module